MASLHDIMLNDRSWLQLGIMTPHSGILHFEINLSLIFCELFLILNFMGMKVNIQWVSFIELNTYEHYEL